MDKERKKEQIEEFHEKFAKADAAFVAGYRGVQVEEITELRNSLRDASVELRVLRNTLAKRALKDTPYEQLSEYFEGQVAVAISYKDAAAAAKALTAFVKTQPKLELKGAALGEKLLSMEDIKGLAELPSREELLAKLLGVFGNVPRNFVGVLSAVPRSLVYTLQAIKVSKEA